MEVELIVFDVIEHLLSFNDSLRMQGRKHTFAMALYFFKAGPSFPQRR